MQGGKMSYKDEVKKMLKAGKGMTVAQIHEGLTKKVSKDTVRVYLNKLAARGEVVKSGKPFQFSLPKKEKPKGKKRANSKYAQTLSLLKRRKSISRNELAELTDSDVKNLMVRISYMRKGGRDGKGTPLDIQYDRENKRYSLAR